MVTLVTLTKAANNQFTCLARVRGLSEVIYVGKGFIGFVGWCCGIV